MTKFLILSHHINSNGDICFNHKESLLHSLSRQRQKNTKVCMALFSVETEQAKKVNSIEKDQRDHRLLQPLDEIKD